ncbi:nitrite reductase small subunit NirD [Krasilnikoviella flava]|uniref:Assimilatory nitrite reductase (NAD(P)H) small subunit n=1 Tax=Krasilnikoviella flava TaxID=526729 RepID=A0A1T5I707_9MICO|nr:nitrite reductase small subunit NirD [Krasilnikoviella flava]SKC34898.1 assimilatory nitrite reductase (NAD(P)H) small subunit [Krasilnikoviella flava]
MTALTPTSETAVVDGPGWTAVCPLDALAPERGAAALVTGSDGEERQVALFRLLDGTVCAVQQLDPYSGANVMSRGIVGTRGGTPTVASPVYKQVFELHTGRCLDAASKEPRVGLAADLASYPVVVTGGVVHVGIG